MREWIKPYIYLCESVEGSLSDEDGWDVGWYFADETEDLNGPFETHEEAEKALADYVLALDGHEEAE